MRSTRATGNDLSVVPAPVGAGGDGARGAAGRRSSRRRARIRVVFVAELAELDESGTALVRLLRAVRAHVEAHVVLGRDGPLRERLEEAGAAVQVLPLGGGPGAVWRLRREIRRLRPDVVQTGSLTAAVEGGVAGRLAGVPVVWSLHEGVTTDRLPRSTVTLVRLLSRVVPARIVTNSRTTLATLPQAGRASTLFHPVILGIAPPVTPAPPPELAVSLQPACTPEPPGPARFGVAGSLSPGHGHPAFFEAFARAFAPGQAVARVMGEAGPGDEAYVVGLHRQVERLGIAADVVWRGTAPEDPEAALATELAGLDVLVHPSTAAEPSGGVLIEAMAAGVPVIAAASGDALEIVRDGEDGVLVEGGDVDALAAALGSLAADPARRAALAATGRRTSQRYGATAVRLRLVDVYEQLRG